MTLFEFLVLSLASWRIASLLVDEAGPFDVFERLRVFVGIKYDQKNEPFATNEIAKQFMCIWCMSLLVSIFIVVFYMCSNTVIYFLLPFALSSVGMLADKMLWRGYKRSH